jgi:hypothetical protein
MTEKSGSITLRASVAIPLPAGSVAEFVLDWSNDPVWRAHVLDFRCDPPGGAVIGQELVEKLRFAGLTFRTTTRVMDASEFAASYEGGLGMVHCTGARVVTPISDERSRFTSVLRLDFRRPMRLLAPALESSYRRADATDVAGLPAILQARRPVHVREVA